MFSKSSWSMFFTNSNKFQDFICKKCVRFLSRPTKSTTLEQIGAFERCKTDTKYHTGQMFLHRIFAYRGIILYPWTARIYERNGNKLKSPPQNNESVSDCTHSSPQIQTYYQVLIDSRDSPHIAAQSEAVTFLTAAGPNNTRLLHTIPGIDYVSHEDILPYQSYENIAIRHILYDKFFESSENDNLALQATDTLNAWQKENHTCLELTKVHRETSNGIRVTAIPFFLGVREMANSQPSEYWWRYCIRIENLSPISARLRERHWRIISNGSVKTIRGRGVVGREPLLNSDQPAFQYSSHISISSPTGHTWGTFRFEREDSEQFDVRVPAFALENNIATTASTQPDHTI